MRRGLLGRTLLNDYQKSRRRSVPDELDIVLDGTGNPKNTT